jgi:hypothetical protein
VLGLVIFLKWNENSTAYVQTSAPGYIDDSRIFLLSANASYGIYDWTPCFVAHLSIRNDYTSQQPPDNETANSTGTAWLLVAAKLYDKDGGQISAQRFTFGYPPSYGEISLGSGETAELDVVMATSSRNVDHYVLVFGWLGSFPSP